jgi:arsenite-transporting ATPase
MDHRFKKFDSNLQNIVNQQSLTWIFVGGKGGVGKTTVSSSLAVLLSKYRQGNVLIISTDPAHNLSDAFDQKLGTTPTKIKEFNNLYGLVTICNP